MENEIDVDLFVEQLKEGKDPRTQRTLGVVKNTYDEYVASAKFKFNNKIILTEIAALCEKKENGIGYVTLRSKRYPHYRKLHDVYVAKFVDTGKKGARPNITSEFDLVKDIKDDTVRGHLLDIIRQRNDYRRNCNRLKQEAKQTELRNYEFKTIESLNDKLEDEHIDALRNSVSDKFMDSKNWKFNWKNGSVKDDNGERIYRTGYLHAIKIILDIVDGNTSNKNNSTPYTDVEATDA